MTLRREGESAWRSAAGEAGPVGIRHSLMLQMNEHLVLDFVHRRETTTRPQIAAGLALSPATVSRIVRRLVEQDLVRERPGTSQGGRPPTIISFNPLSGAVIGIDLGGYKCHGVLADLAGDILFEDVRPTGDGGDPFATLTQMLRRLLDHAQDSRVPARAVAVGVPAIVEADSGVATGGPNVRWHGFPIAAALARELEIPFVVDNEANLAALGHAWRGDAIGVRTFAVLNLGTGIGAAVVVDGQLLQGRRSGAGEIGYMVLERSQLGSVRTDDRGSFELLAGGPAITENARRRLAGSSPSSLLAEAGDRPSPKLVFEAAAKGDETALAVVSDVTEYVAMSILAMATTIDPEIIILDGFIGRALEPARPRIEELVSHHLPSSPRIAISSLGDRATPFGAVAAALDLSRSQRRPRGIPRGGS